jgi:SAM-dependent methyltransferase
MMNDDFLKRKKYQDIGRWYITNFVKRVAISIRKDSLILDAGAGECVYKDLFSHCIYKSIDLAIGESNWNYTNLDYIGYLHEMPLENNTFDAVLCTQVLEHLEKPRESISEMYRVLKPGGRLLMTAPMSQNEHQIPYDFFRYTSYGIISLCRDAGFNSIKVSPFGGLWVRWAYELPRALTIFPSSGLIRKQPNLFGILFLPLRLFFRIFIYFLQVFFLWLDNFDKVKNDPFGWACEAVK